jgi:hypothetical protein
VKQVNFVARERAMHPFEAYLKLQNLEALTVSIKAGIRYITVWNAMKGNPITGANAQKIRQAVITLTGVPYIGPFVLFPERPVDQIQTLRLKRFKKQETIENTGRWRREKS